MSKFLGRLLESKAFASYIDKHREDISANEVAKLKGEKVEDDRYTWDVFGGRPAFERLAKSRNPEADLDALIVATEKEGKYEAADKLKGFRREFQLQRAEIENGFRKNYANARQQARVEAQAELKKAEVQKAAANAAATSTSQGTGGGGATGGTRKDVGDDARYYVKKLRKSDPGNPHLSELQSLLTARNSIKGGSAQENEVKRQAIDVQLNTVIDKIQGTTGERTDATAGARRQVGVQRDRSVRGAAASAAPRTRISMGSGERQSKIGKALQRKEKQRGGKDLSAQAALESANKRVAAIKRQMRDKVQLLKDTSNEVIREQLKTQLKTLDGMLTGAYIALERIKGISGLTQEVSQATLNQSNQLIIDAQAISELLSDETGEQSQVFTAMQLMDQKLGGTRVETSSFEVTKQLERPAQIEWEDIKERSYEDAEAAMERLDADEDDAGIEAIQDLKDAGFNDEEIEELLGAVSAEAEVEAEEPSEGEQGEEEGEEPPAEADEDKELEEIGKSIQGLSGIYAKAKGDQKAKIASALLVLRKALGKVTGAAPQKGDDEVAEAYDLFTDGGNACVELVLERLVAGIEGTDEELELALLESAANLVAENDDADLIVEAVGSYANILLNSLTMEAKVRGSLLYMTEGAEGTAHQWEAAMGEEISSLLTSEGYERVMGIQEAMNSLSTDERLAFRLSVREYMEKNEFYLFGECFDNAAASVLSRTGTVETTVNEISEATEGTDDLFRNKDFLNALIAVCDEAVER